jgi:hypothetical protein
MRLGVPFIVPRQMELMEANKEGYPCLLSGGAPDRPVHHRTTTVHVWCAISFLFWRRRPLQIRGSWRTRHCPVHTRQSGAPCRPLARATRRPRIARSTVALATVGSPDSPVHHRTVRRIIALHRQIFPRVACSPESNLVHHRTVRCAKLSLTSAVHNQVTCNPFLLFFSLFLALRQNMLVLKTMY